MRKDPLVTNEYYHIYNRGVDKRDIFMDKKDLLRFARSIKAFNTIDPVGSIRSKSDKQEPLVSIVCYCINPNHFHFVLKQEIDGGISEFLKRLLGGYTKYFNKVHDRSGSLFQGRFKSNLISEEQYFLKIIPYVNNNYLIHDILPDKKYLIMASDKEYEKMSFNIVSKKEAKEVLNNFYGGIKDFQEECKKVVSIIRDQREKTPLFIE